MQIIVEYTDNQALKLLQDLEQLNILRLLPLKPEKMLLPQKRKWAGTISSETATALHLHVEQSRNEWEINI